MRLAGSMWSATSKTHCSPYAAGELPHHAMQSLPLAYSRLNVVVGLPLSLLLASLPNP